MKTVTEVSRTVLLRPLLTMFLPAAAAFLLTGGVLDGLYSRASLFTFPSLYDNAPMVVREAAVMGTPALMARGSSAAEIIRDGENGYLCQNTPADMARVMRGVIANPEDARRIGQNAHDTIPIAWMTIMENVVERYERLIALGREGKLSKKYLRVI